jgi:hypothetical protein
MCAHENPDETRDAVFYLNDDERMILYHYAHDELHVPEIVEEIVFLSVDERKSVLDLIRLLKKTFLDGHRQRRKKSD